VDTTHKVFQEQTVLQNIDGWFRREQMSQDDINRKLNKDGHEGGGQIVLVQYRNPTRAGFRRNGQNAGCCAHRPDHAAAAALPSARPPSEAQSAQSNTSAYECLCGRRCSLF
jgi:hypothetical protein